MTNAQNATKYVESRRCVTYQKEFLQVNECQDYEIYCPNKGKCLSDVNKCQAHFYFGNETQCKIQNMYHCSKSNQCIWQDWVCDGFVQCIKGDDEDFHLCNKRESFDEGATVKCTEAERFGYNITILATKCNGRTECKDGNDEVDCQKDDTAGLIAIGIMFWTIAVIWIAIHLKFAPDDDTSQESRYDSNMACLKGDELAMLKVSKCQMLFE